MGGYGASEGSDTLPSGTSLRGNQTILSQNGNFELGFFNPNGTSNWYVGIWYAKISARAYVWVANRENPLTNMPGVLKLSRGGELGLFDADGASLWSPNATKAASEALLRDSGNFVMVGAENKSETVWESFDHPVDTWLSGMKMRRESKLISWRNSVDPGPGIFSIEMDRLGALQFVIRWNDSVQYWATGAWNGKLFANIPEMASSRYIFSVENATSGVYFTYSISASMDELSHFVMDKAGAFRLYKPIADKEWLSSWAEPRDQCEVYGLCGVNGVCNPNNIQFCSCLLGFEPRDAQAWGSQEWWTGGCVASQFRSSSSSKGRRNKLALVVSVIVVFAILASLLFWWRRSKRGCAQALASCLALRFTVASRCTRPAANDFDATTSIRMFTYRKLQISTRNFTHKLGSGAFGSVFRGTLPDGTLIAIKKLQGKRQGEKQFRAETNTLGSINHVNLIRLRGFCAERSRRLLVYDYMPNGSLDTFLFSKKSRNEKEVEDWKIRFEIALGVARGLVYLHEECKERIIHCDVKPENILLDGNFCPKLADFGLAKLVGRDFSRVLTTTRGTRGYLAPEWISGLPITPKADVYSFGMTLLEIISGRRNLDLGVQESSKFYFPTWAASQIHKEDTMSVVDSRIAESADEEEVRRAGVVSMLCIEDDEAVRPSMGEALLMLEGKMDLRTPQIPRSLCRLVGQQQGGLTDDTDSSF